MIKFKKRELLESASHIKGIIKAFDPETKEILDTYVTENMRYWNYNGETRDEVISKINTLIDCYKIAMIKKYNG